LGGEGTTFGKGGPGKIPSLSGRDFLEIGEGGNRSAFQGETGVAWIEWARKNPERAYAV